MLHYNSAISVARYLYSTKDRVIRYVRHPSEAHRNIPYVLNFTPGDGTEESFRVFVDADYAGSHDFRSCTGYISFLNGAPVQWSSKIQRLTAQSTTEAELVAMAESLKETLNLKLFLEELGIRRPDDPVPVMEDNSAATTMATSGANHPKAKHYRVRLNFIRENTQPVDGSPPTIHIVQTPTALQLADGLTKTLTKDLFNVFQNAVTGKPLASPSSSAASSGTN